MPGMAHWRGLPRGSISQRKQVFPVELVPTPPACFSASSPNEGFHCTGACSRGAGAFRTAMTCDLQPEVGTGHQGNSSHSLSPRCSALRLALSSLLAVSQPPALPEPLAGPGRMCLQQELCQPTLPGSLFHLPLFTQGSSGPSPLLPRTPNTEQAGDKKAWQGFAGQQPVGARPWPQGSLRVDPGSPQKPSLTR